eukprot:TRINITY_DN7079_c0_g1_i2.p1 TRINITY_DN7079_c0_g1~~TRINITY_DN7079_c0_g1_i2.p1  ORF type:complete len:1404 (-),score=206.72 TRINITY_DN7079_c0_g1_i2:68-4234(-)
MQAARTQMSVIWALVVQALGNSDWYLVNKWQHEFDGSPSGRADVLNEFFSAHSLGQNGKLGDGLDRWGNYVKAGSQVKAGLQTREDLQAWPLTFAAGHAFFSSSSSPAWGKLQGQNWKTYARSVSTQIDLAHESPDVLRKSVLVVENSVSSSQGSSPLLLSVSPLFRSKDTCSVSPGFSTVGTVLQQECGNLQAFDCCSRCYLGSHAGQCAAVDLKDGCCTYYSSAEGQQPAASTTAITSGVGPTPVPVPTANPVELMGIVVRKGGVLFIDDVDMDLRVNFIIVESGGLLQAGSHENDQFRFMSKLTITLTHDPASDYANTPVPASQYSAEVHHPGYAQNGPGSTLEDFVGMHGSNSGGPKAVNVFFNGNFQLNGFVPSLVEYKQTWKATHGDDNWNDIDPLTTADADGAPPDYKWPSAYHMVWARLASPGAQKGDLTIKLEADDFNQQSLLQDHTWAEGDQILITARTARFTDGQNGQHIGMPRVWMDNLEGSTSYSDNDAANDKFKALLGGSMEEAGVEVATISGVNSDGRITLKHPLRFNHRSEDMALTNKQGQTLNVQTRLHIGWLSRRITVTSEQTNGGGGCNNLPSSVSSPRNGPMGRVVKNFGEGFWNGRQRPGEVRKRCFMNEDEDSEYTGGELPERNVVGHWMFGTSGLKGCNALWGGQQIFRYGSSVSLDGVEVTKMGTPGNFGTMGQYAVHFHMAGYAKSFKDFLPQGAKQQGHSRELRVVSCSIWRTYVRWVTVHGTMEAEIRNNVGFLTYGSGYFVEDGSEVRNIFDHNMGIMAMTAVRNAYWNPSPVYPYTSPDYGSMSTFWFKNSQNIFTRNVMANSPTPVVGVWYVPQAIGMLRGASVVLIGSEKLGLPGVASEGSALGVQGSLNSNGDNNRNGELFGFSKQCGLVSCACYVPDDFTFPLLNPKTGCNTYSRDNQQNPLMTNSENVVYNMVGFYSEFPEGIAFGPMKYVDKGAQIIGVGFEQQFNFEGQGGPAPQFLPENGLNDCTDGGIAIDIYPVPRWDREGLQWQPLSPEEFTDIDSQCNVQTPQIPHVGASQVPKMIANLLLWNTGPEISALWYGAGWMKQVPPMFINCAFLSDSDGDTRASASLPQGRSSVAGSLISATNFVWGYRLPNAAMVGTLGVYHNLILNGGLAAVPSPTLFTGKGTFIDQRSVLGGSPTEGAGSVVGDAPAFNYFFDNLAGSVDAIFGDLWTQIDYPGDHESGAVPAVLQLIDMTANRLKRIRMNTNEVLTQWADVEVGDRYIKFPYLCGDQQDGWGLRRASPSWPSELTISIVIGGLFESTIGQKVGDEVCKALSLTLPRLPPSDLNGNPADFLVVDSGGTSVTANCNIPTHLLPVSLLSAKMSAATKLAPCAPAFLVVGVPALLLQFAM